MSIGSTFNRQILVEKLTKLNASQASIETLSHWCIFHMSKAKYVVETWNKQFHCSSREQRLAFLYLANDILQNSRRKGADFVAEFWKVLPSALHDVIQNGDASGKNVALRLINIWDERKVFGSRGHMLKEELVGRRPEISAKTGRHFSLDVNHSAGSSLDKIVSAYKDIYGGQLDEDVILNRCRNAISYVEKATKDDGGNMTSGQVDGAGFVVEEVQHQLIGLRGCIDQLKTVEASRARLVSHLREALLEQEFKLGQVRTQLQAAQSLSDQAANKLQHSESSANMLLGDDKVVKEAHPPKVSPDFAPENTGQPSAVLYTRQASLPERSGAMDGKSAAAALAAKLTASTSSAQMLSLALSSLAQEGVIGNRVKDGSEDYQPEKKQKLENDQAYVPQHASQTPPPPHFKISNNDDQNPNQQPPPPPSLSQQPPLPMMPPYPMPQYMQAAGVMSNAPYTYGSAPLQPPPPMTGYLPLAPPAIGRAPPPPNPYQTEGGFYTQQSPLPAAPISRQ